MAYYKECEHCGAKLDPGETCDCLVNTALRVTDEEVKEVLDPRNESVMRKKYEHAGETVKIKSGVGKSSFGEDMSGQDFIIEDWCANVWGKSWMDMTGNPTALEYAMRTCISGENNHVPAFSNDVLYGKVGFYAHLFHINELELEDL